MSSFPEDDNANPHWRAWEEQHRWWSYPREPGWLRSTEWAVREAREFLAQLRAENATIPMSAADRIAPLEEACRMSQLASDAHYAEATMQRALYRKLIERGEAP